MWNRRLRRRAQQPRRAHGRPSSPRIPRLRLGGRRHLDDDGVIETREARRQARRCSPTTSRRTRCTDGAHRHRPHPLGDARRADRPQRAPAPRRRRRLALIHNGIIENFSELKDELARRGLHLRERDRHRGRRRAARPRVPPRRRPHRGVPRDRRRASTAPSPCSPCTRTSPASSSAPAATRRSSSASATARTSSARMSPPSSSTPSAPWRSARTRSSRSPPTASPSPTSTATPVEVEPFDVAWDASAAEKGGWSSLHGARRSSEQPEAVANTLRGRVARRRGRTSPSSTSFGDDELARHPSHHRDRVRHGRLRGHGRASTPSRSGRASPSRSSSATSSATASPVLDDDTLVVSISQSGETMDTLMAVKYARETGARTISICNTQGATIPRESDAVRLHARRPRGRGRVDEGVRRADHRALPLRPAPRARARHAHRRASSRTQLAELQAVPEKLETVLGQAERGRRSSRTGWPTPASVLFLGRHVGYPIALEGALKLKELAYIHAEGFAAGELKHGPIALIEPGQPVFVVVPSPRGSANLHPKVVSNIQEIRARGARVIAIAEAGRRRGAAVRRRGASASRSPRRSSSRCSRSCRCRSSRWSSRRRRASTSTSRATSRSPSRSSDPGAGGAVIVGIGIDVVDIARFERVDRAHAGARRALVR